MYLMNAKLVQTSRNTRVVSFGCPCIDVFDGFTHGITAATLYASMENNGHPVSRNRFFGLCLLGTPSFMDLFLSDVFSAVMSHSFKSQLHQLMANALCTLACSGCYLLESACRTAEVCKYFYLYLHSLVIFIVIVPCTKNNWVHFI